MKDRLADISAWAKRGAVALVAAGASLSAWAAKDGPVVNLSDYLAQYSVGEDATLAFRRALDDCKRVKASRLVIPEGTYKLFPELAAEKYAYVTNNSAGLKRFAFDLAHMDDFTIDGGGSLLLLHGYISAFTVDTCRNITIENLKIDYERTFHSEGRIVAAGDGWLDLKFPKDYVFKIRNGDLHFSDTRGNDYPFSHLLEINSERKEPEHYASDYWLSDQTIPAELRADSTVRIFKDKLTGKPGNVMLLGPAHRLCPAFAINETHGILLRNIDIYHCGGMGVVAQHSSDIELNGVRIDLAPGSDRMISITADATHFTHCEGYLRMIDCRFFNQIDDATNIHGMYGIVKKIVAPDKVRVFFPHDQQYGLDILRAGRDAEMLKQPTLQTYDTIRVKSVDRLNKEWYEVTFDKDVAAQATEGDLITEMSYPEVLIKGCAMGNNRARGLLLGSRRPTVVEDCYFHVPGSPIYFEGDGYYWYEQAGVRDVTIRNNHFDNCNYGYRNWGSACIASGNGPREGRKESRYNRNITIEGNRFTVFDPRILNLYSTDGIIFRNNKIEQSDTKAYKYALPEKRAFVTEDCINVKIEK